MIDEATRADRLAGALLGTALGDALGLPCEGMSSRAIARRFGRVDRFRLLGRWGFVSDDTEQAALVAQSLARSPDDPDRAAADFRRSMVGWLARLPFGVGRATIRATVRMALGFRPSGVMSAGNGSAMRAVVVGVCFAEDRDRRVAFGQALAEATHRDPRATDGALFVAEVAAACVTLVPEATPTEILRHARPIVQTPGLAEAIDQAIALATAGVDPASAAATLGTSGFVIHTVAFAAYSFGRSTRDITASLADAIAVGGDADTIAAILGGWLGARLGTAPLPRPLIDRLHDGPFGPTHLRRLAHCLAATRAGLPATLPRYPWPAALLRNLALYPVVLAHGFRRLIPW